MKKVQLGNTDLQVSQMGLGCLYFGARDSKEKSFRRMDQYLAAGGNFLDTANIYSHWIDDQTKGGESEKMIAEWLQARNNRSEVIIASKVGFPYPGTEYGTSKEQIKEEFHKSLKRLGTNYIDLYYAHTDDFGTPMEETLEAFNELITEGKVRAIGASNFKAWRLERARQIAKRNNWQSYSAIQQRYSYLRPKSGWDFGNQVAANQGLFEFVKDTGISLVAYSPLLQGAYTNPNKEFKEHYQGPDTDKRLAILDEIAEETGATRNQLVYYWLMNRDPEAIPLIAATTDEQFKEAIGSLELDLSEDMMKAMTETKF
ncbi:aryl-alcohol dehydrogenase-like predicted oxidoreductase [Halanaerobium saccharolyticum]|uniref:Aryl-alcohol dehydrogenase-like predicted oxidoreductase n=1 Tax=Halanaerobium saccharolyticum TaxID=43595 RepID=A0A4R7Z0B3_9FIRM|nr:aldo/keto reductase [Halanaerobium saccharolyticum]RAK07179.1 aryl-alcohol dehydrogenase-like predicted oxidoreductase [Halanaerobium saccharolyticum]TDW02092.1 aryl-alcohol dehydrogenase-like predicted oxidoreductase [Halanaerobium saccharolyticum]TDX58823.1 aryl-alcohol dehydrogenase-like predicted oxidoreductase [Halanaerobium saccharolyticum]